MRLLTSILGAAAAVACAMPLNAATQAVHDVPTRPGVYNRILVITPDTPPVATVLLLAGGDGALRLGSDGTIGALAGNFLVRSRDLFAAQGFTTVLVDAPSDRVDTVGLASFRQTPEHAFDIATVIDYIRQLRPEPIWLIGTSNGTLSAAFLSFTLPQATAFGVVLTSSILASDANTRDLLEMPLEGNQRATLVVHNELDQCGSCPPASVPTLMQHLAAASVKEAIMFNGGAAPIAGPCEGKAYHGYFGIESEVVSSIATWIVAHPPVINTTSQVGPGWNLLGNSLNQALQVATVFNDASWVHSVWKWDSGPGRWQIHSPQMDSATLQAYALSKGFDVLSTINPGEGYWINAITSSSSPVQGAPFNLGPSSLVPGWNLVATGGDVAPAAFNRSLSAAPPAAGTVPLNINSLWAWDNLSGRWYFYAPYLEAQGGTALNDYINGKGFLDFAQHSRKLGRGTGFWVHR